MRPLRAIPAAVLVAFLAPSPVAPAAQASDGGSAAPGAVAPEPAGPEPEEPKPGETRPAIPGPKDAEPAEPKPARPAPEAADTVELECQAILAGIDPGASPSRAASEIFLAIERRARTEGPRFRARMLGTLAASGTERAFATLDQYARAPRPDLRADAMEGLARASSDAAMPMLESGLADEHPDVRWCAIQAAGSLRRNAAVGLLIGRLRLEPEPDLRTSAHGLLVKMTGISIGPSPRDWAAWWETAEGGFRFPDSGARPRTAVGPPSASTVPRFFGIEVGSRRVAFLVDISSSMLEVVPVRTSPAVDRTSGPAAKPTTGAPREGTTSVGDGTSTKGRGDGGGTGVGKTAPGTTGRARKIDILKRELTSVLRTLPAETLVHIVTFHEAFASWAPELRSLEGEGRDRAIAFVQGFVNGVGTNVFDTLEFALRDRRLDTIYLLTDGIPTEGKIVEPSEILAAIRKRNIVRRVAIHTVAFGAESELLRSLAAQNGGTYRFVDRY